MDDDKAVGMTTDAKPLPLSAEELVNLNKTNPASFDGAGRQWLAETLRRLLATIANITQQRDGWEGAAQGFEKRAVDAEATIAQQAEQIAVLKDEVGYITSQRDTVARAVTGLDANIQRWVDFANETRERMTALIFPRIVEQHTQEQSAERSAALTPGDPT